MRRGIAILWLLLAAGGVGAAEQAEPAFRRGDYARAAAAGNASATRAALLRGLLAEERGDRKTSREEFTRLCAAAEAGRRRGASDLADAAEACRHLGRFHEANRVFERAAGAEPKNADIRARWGRLFLLAHNEAEAQKLFEEAQKLDPAHPGALVGLAELLSDRWDSGAEKPIEKALAADPEFVPAHLLAARMALDEEQTDAAAAYVERALAVNPRSLEAMALGAAVAYQRGDSAGVERGVAEALKADPVYGRVYEPLGRLAGIGRQLAAAADFYRRGLRLDPELWDLQTKLGIALFRLGREEEARRALEAAYDGDPFNVQTVNTLRLMDSFARYDQFDTPHFRVKLHQKESAALRPYVEELLERSLRALAERYRYMPAEKVSFEMFPDHEDFAVRALGLPGLGALGVSFGAIVAMDSPAARPAGSFHWGSTLWHEMAHVVTLGASDNRVPRWFTEGLSVYEEQRAGWGDRLDLETVRALQENKLVPVAQLNAAFVRPKFPGQVQFAYYQAGMFCRFIAEKHGFEKILALLAAFRSGEKPDAALERVLGRPLDDLDRAFRAWLQPLTAKPMSAIDLDWRQPRPRKELEAEAARRPQNFFARLQLARAFQDDNRPAEALGHAEAARELFPEAVEAGGPYELAAEIHLARGERDKAAAELQRWLRAGGHDPQMARRLADLLMELGRPRQAAEVWEAFLYVAPLDAELHQRLGEFYLESRPGAEAIREFSVVLALKPVDQAQAHFNLARAYAAAGRRPEARREVLAALEIAPGFSPAQKLLLELSQ